MKQRILTTCTAFLLVIVMCFQTAAEVHAVSVKPGDTATEENVLAVLRQYDADAYHIMTSKNSGIGFMTWFMGRSLIAGIDTAVHETYHGYTSAQSNTFYGEKIFLGDGKSYDVDYSIVYKGAFTKTEEMSKQIPSQLQTFRYKEYVAPGTNLDANTKGVFGLLNEFTAYYWGLETMNSLSQFLIDTDAGADAWSAYVNSIGNNMTAYAEFKYWTLRYMLYIQSANPSLYQAILDNKNYCSAYRDADAAFVSEIAKSKEIINNSSDYMSAKGFSVDWSDSGIYLRNGSSGSSGSGGSMNGDFSSWLNDFLSSMGQFGSWGGGFTGTGLSLSNYNTLMAELETAEYIQMDAILKNGGAVQTETPGVSFTDVPKWCADAVTWAAESGITTGTSKRTFSPNTTCNQAQILTFLWRAKGEPKPAAAVSSGSYYANAAQWAREQGITDDFSAEAPCTRAMAVTYLWKLMGSPKAGSTRFSDVPADAGYAQAVAWAVANGITTGTSSTTFSPDTTCTRGQIVTFLYRLLAK